MRVGLFPYKPGANPYQRLCAESLRGAGIDVETISPRKMCPIDYALKNQVDILHLDWPHDFYLGRNRITTVAKKMMYVGGLAKLKRSPCVWTAHNLISHDSKKPAYEAKMIQKLVTVCDAIVVLSTAQASELQSTYKVPDHIEVCVIPHGHYIDSYRNDIGRGDARRKLSIKRRARVVLFLGRVLPYKGIDRLITEFHSVATENDVLLIAGPVQDESLKKQLDEQVSHAIGNGIDIRLHLRLIPDDQLQVYFNASDVVATPFRSVANSGSMMLAMSFGKCVVAPIVGSLPEIACPSGFFGYEQDDPDGLGRSLRLALSCRDREELERKILSFTRSNYSWSEIGLRLRALYERVLTSYK